MKFAKHLAKAVNISDPEWAPYWINYKQLKKVIKKSCRCHEPEGIAPPAGVEARGGRACSSKPTPPPPSASLYSTSDASAALAAAGVGSGGGSERRSTSLLASPKRRISTNSSTNKEHKRLDAPEQQPPVMAQARVTVATVAPPAQLSAGVLHSPPLPEVPTPSHLRSRPWKRVRVRAEQEAESKQQQQQQQRLPASLLRPTANATAHLEIYRPDLLNNKRRCIGAGNSTVVMTEKIIKQNGEVLSASHRVPRNTGGSSGWSESGRRGERDAEGEKEGECEREGVGEGGGGAEGVCPFFDALMTQVDKCTVFFLQSEKDLKVCCT